MARMKYNPEVQAYYDAFKAMMRTPSRVNLSVDDKLLAVGCAIADSDCPLNCHMTRGIFPAVAEIADLIGEGVSSVRDGIFRLSGNLGFFDAVRKHGKLCPAIPREAEIRSIYNKRAELEIEALLAVHRLTDFSRKREAVEKLERANARIHGLLRLTSRFSSTELAKRAATDPTIGDLAEDFWRSDRDLHLAASCAAEMPLHRGLTHTLLDKSRLHGSNRVKILLRIPQSFKEHDAIIAAVAAAVGPSSEAKIAEAVKHHLESSRKHF